MKAAAALLQYGMTESDQISLKRAAAVKALGFLQDGLKLGLGTGTTAEAFIEVLAERVTEGLQIRVAATSERSAARAGSLGITTVPLDDLAPLDLTIDGADEADRDLRLIKGGGGALLREKLVASASAKMVVICDGSKLVGQLGRFPLAVEVTEFGHLTISRRIAEMLRDLGYVAARLALRSSAGAVFRTDSGNVIYDCALGHIGEPERLAEGLKSITGVVEHGLFIGLATTLVVAHGPEQVEIIERVKRG